MALLVQRNDSFSAPVVPFLCRNKKLPLLWDSCVSGHNFEMKSARIHRSVSLLAQSNKAIDKIIRSPHYFTYSLFRFKNSQRRKSWEGAYILFDSTSFGHHKWTHHLNIVSLCCLVNSSWYEYVEIDLQLILRESFHELA